jgi:hypothetical protein
VHPEHQGGAAAMRFFKSALFPLLMVVLTVFIATVFIERMGY